MVNFIGHGGHWKVCREIMTDQDGWFIAVGDNYTRKIEVLACPGPFITLIHKDAIVSPSAKIGEGSVIMAGAVIQAEAIIGKHCILNTIFCRS